MYSGNPSVRDLIVVRREKSNEKEKKKEKKCLTYHRRQLTLTRTMDDTIRAIVDSPVSNKLR
jgi:hypothetical protein